MTSWLRTTYLCILVCIIIINNTSMVNTVSLFINTVSLFINTVSLFMNTVSLFMNTVSYKYCVRIYIPSSYYFMNTSMLCGNTQRTCYTILYNYVIPNTSIMWIPHRIYYIKYICKHPALICICNEQWGCGIEVTWLSSCAHQRPRGKRKTRDGFCMVLVKPLVLVASHWIWYTTTILDSDAIQYCC